MTGEPVTPPSVQQARGSSWLVGAVAVSVTTTFFTLFVPDLRHWFVLPVLVCGVLVAPDAVDWARRRLDTFDPQALLGLMGLHFFYLAPILHVTFDYWALYVPPAADWRDALGRMALLNVLGLTVYRAVVGPRTKVATAPAAPTDIRKLYATGLVTIAVSLATFFLVVYSFGGLSGYLTTFADDREQLVGLGGTLLVSSAFPLVAYTLVVVRFRATLRKHPALLVLVMLLFVFALFFSGGLRGSRSFTVWALLIALGMCHLLVVRIRRRVLCTTFLVVLAFMYFYGFYKNVGGDTLGLLTGETSTEELTGETDRDLRYLLLSDLGRADIQALVLERQREGTGELGNGITYLGALSFMVPRFVLPDRPPDKVEVGTNMLYGQGTYETGFRASRIYGVAGEGILNFGAVGAIVSFVPLGMFVRFARAKYRRAAADQAIGGKLLAPALSVCVVLALGSDFNNLAWFVVNQVLVPAGIVFLSRSTPVRSAVGKSGTARKTDRARQRTTAAAEGTPEPTRRTTGSTFVEAVPNQTISTEHHFPPPSHTAIQETRTIGPV